MPPQVLDGQTFVRLIEGGAANLRLNEEIVNDLNVFPIPDGDTGANMSMTLDGGLRQVSGYTEPSVDKAAELLADGMLLSARGNSGVILSRLFAGISQGLKGKQLAGVTDLADAMREGVKSAYASVVNPTEGTILTVAREAIEYAAGRITEESTPASFGEDYFTELSASLQRTPELLDVLKEAGVIDSGGAGLYYIVDGILRTYRGEKIEAGQPPKVSPAPVDFSLFNEDSVMEFGYCTEFLLQLTNAKCDISTFSVDSLIEWLNTMGNSIVAFQNGTIVKVHIHTLTPGTVLNYAQQFGEFLTLKIENMTLQHHETTIDNRFPSAVSQKISPRKDFALVTVATGDGIRDTFTSLGADIVIDGGQGKNPSAQDFVNAFNTVNAENIFVLPNNGNIIMAAKQAAELFKDSRVHVIESKNIGDGYAALTMLSYDSGNPEEIASSMREAMDGVITGMVTTSVRDARLNGIEIHRDDYIGFTDKTMLAAASDKNEAAFQLLDQLHAAEHEYLIAIHGAENTEDEKAGFRAEMVRKYPGTELYEIDGGQEIYHYLLILQ